VAQKLESVGVTSVADLAAVVGADGVSSFTPASHIHPSMVGRIFEREIVQASPPFV